MHLEIQNILRTSFGSLYDRVVVRRVTRGSKQYTVNITGINCRYCQNIGREHASNNIYFVISKDGVVQRCYDTGSKTAEMRHGLCKEYSSGTIPLSASAASVLWPEANDTLSVFVESTEGIGLKSFAMQALLRSGEYLATLIHNTSWTATLGLQSSKAKRGLKDFVPQDPRDLGARGIEAYKDLGLSWADSLMQLAGPCHEEHHEQAVFQKTIAELERALVDAFDTLVVLAATSNEPETFTCAFMDDFCLSEVQESDDDILIIEFDDVHEVVV